MKSSTIGAMANKKWQWSEQSKHGHLAMKSYEKNVFIAMQKSKGTMQKISVALGKCVAEETFQTNENSIEIAQKFQSQRWPKCNIFSRITTQKIYPNGTHTRFHREKMHQLVS